LTRLSGIPGFELQPYDATAAAALNRGPEIADQVLGLLLDLDVAVADDPERASAEHLVFRKEIVGLPANERFERDVTAGRARDSNEAREARGAS
jgi:hypothetical protein